MDYRRAALIEVFGNLPDTELRKLGHDLQAHHLNAMKSGKVVLLPTEIHKIVHDLTHLAGNAYAGGETDNAQVLIECAQMLLAQFTIK